MATMGKEEDFLAMIEELDRFCKEIVSARDILATAASTCATLMQNDEASAGASQRVYACAQEYDEALNSAVKLKKKLIDRLAQIREYKKRMRELRGE